MKKIVVFIFLFGIITSGLYFYSCNKDSIIVESTFEKNIPIEVRKTWNLDFPSLNGDRLMFDDVQHFEDYFEDLTEIYEQDLSGFIDTILNNDRIDCVFEKLYSDEYTSTSGSYEPFLSDPVMMTIVNQYYEFQIDDVLVTYMNDEEIIICDATDSSTRDTIRNLTKGSRIDVEDIPTLAYWGEDDNLQALVGKWCGCEVYVEVIDCDNVRIFGSCKNTVWGDGEGDLDIWITTSSSWPEGTFQPTYSYEVDGSFEFIIDMSYAQSIKWIHVKADPNCIFGQNVYVSFEFDPTDDQCDFNEANTGYLYKTSGNEQIKFKVSYYKNFWSSYEETQLFSRTWDSNENEYVRTNANLTATIDASRRGPACGVVETEDETDNCSSCSYESVRVNSGIFGAKRWLYHCDDDVEGSVRKVRNNITIIDSETLDFDCCL
jgi:hypothetical protein